MKTLRVNGMLSLLFLLSGSMVGFGQEMNVPGDNFSLEGALELFKKSGSPEEFEKLLNTSESKVNNLDLNGDGYIDYIRVIDTNEGNVHAFILQATISETERQDIAVIELEKLANGKAVLQITGDEDIYGIETIIEPTSEVRVNAGTSTQRVVVNVWTWPSVQYIYGTYYSGWISPWGWASRPVWWHTWRPVAYYEYNPWWQSYRPYYSVCQTHRIVYARQIYRPYRTTSVIVHNRHNTQIANYRSTRDHHDRKRDQYDDRSGSSRNHEVSRAPSTSRDDFSSRRKSTGNVERMPHASDRSSWAQQRDLSDRRATNNNLRSQQSMRQNPSLNNEHRQAVPNAGSNRVWQAPTNDSRSRQPAIRQAAPMERRAISGGTQSKQRGVRENSAVKKSSGTVKKRGN